MTQTKLMDANIVKSYIGEMEQRIRLLATFSPEEVGRIINLHPIKVRTACGNGTIKAVKIGRAWMIPISEVERIQSEGITLKKGK